jgi:hypothetical protein
VLHRPAHVFTGLFFGCLGIATIPACSLLTGLNRLAEESCSEACGGQLQCVASCESGKQSLDAAPDNTNIGVGRGDGGSSESAGILDAAGEADSHGDSSFAEAGDGQASPQGDAGREASDGGADAMRDAATCANGIGSLSNIGTKDFHISFRITTNQSGWVALVNQRSVCYFGFFWDIRLCAPGRAGDSCPAAGTVSLETDNNDIASFQDIYSKGSVNDGKAHDVVVARTAGMLTIQIDGTRSGGTASLASFGANMPAVQIGKDVCIGAANGDPTVALTGTLSDQCITSP